jgi:hypothetical protein
LTPTRRDECIRLLQERGACVARPTSPVISRIVQECVLLASVPHLVNEAIVGMAAARRQEKRPRDDA